MNTTEVAYKSKPEIGVMFDRCMLANESLAYIIKKVKDIALKVFGGQRVFDEQSYELWDKFEQSLHPVESAEGLVFTATDRQAIDALISTFKQGVAADDSRVLQVAQIYLLANSFLG